MLHIPPLNVAVIVGIPSVDVLEAKWSSFAKLLCMHFLLIRYSQIRSDFLTKNLKSLGNIRNEVRENWPIVSTTFQMYVKTSTFRIVAKLVGFQTTT